MSFTKALTLAVILGVVATGYPAPAQADNYPISAGSGPGVLFEDCIDHPISYSVSPPANAQSWSIYFTVLAPDGTAAGSAIVSSFDPTSGITTAQLCGRSLMPGTYTLTGTHKVVVSATVHQTPVTPVTFDLRLPLSSVTARPSDETPRRGQMVKVKVRAKDERPTGEFFATPYARVVLQRSVGERWVKVRGAKGETRGNGVVQLRFRQAWLGKTRFRAFANLGYPGRAASAPFVLRTRR